MMMASQTILKTQDGSLLSLPPPSFALAISAFIGSLLLLIGIAVLGGALVNQGSTGEVVHSVGILLSTLGVIASSVVAWFGFRALQASIRSVSLCKNGDILASRASADIARQDAFITFSLLFAMAIIVAVLVIVTMNDASIQRTFLQWELIKSSFKDVLKAFWLNVWLAIVSQFFVLIFGLVLAVARMVPGRAGGPIRAIAITYIDTMRAVPAVIVIYLVGFGLPIAGIPFVSQFAPEWFAVFALTLTFSAYAAEIYRSGIESIHPSQWSATRSLGFSYAQTLRFVILPQAVRRVIPPMLGSFIALQKDTSLVNIIGTMDAFNQAKFYASSNFNLSSVTVVAVLFILITIPQTRFVDWMLARGNKSRR